MKAVDQLRAVIEECDGSNEEIFTLTMGMVASIVMHIDEIPFAETSEALAYASDILKANAPREDMIH